MNYLKIWKIFKRSFFGVVDQLTVPYRWPLLPLYDWSRRLEYPYVADIVLKQEQGRYFDAGSGVTFFTPYLIANSNCEIECFDFDESFVHRTKEVFQALGMEDQLPKYHIGDLTSELYFESESYDIISCISVIEHLPKESRILAINELWRLVKPGGQLILTFDVSLTGEEDGLTPQDLPDFMASLRGIFGDLPMIESSSPRDLLTTEKPGWHLAPLRVGDTVYRPGWKAWVRDMRGLALPGLKPLACLVGNFRKQYD